MNTLGFTLMDSMIGVTLLGVLATVARPHIFGG